jgi:16S rRNA (guanine527-N7)-methyltransferase
MACSGQAKHTGEDSTIYTAEAQAVNAQLTLLQASLALIPTPTMSDSESASLSPPSLLPRLDLWQQTLHWSPSPEQQQQFTTLYALILAGNRQLNLTRITEPEAFWEKHLWDSLAGIAPYLQPQLSHPPDPNSPAWQVIDIGTGGGFPGLPVAIARPDWHVTLLDSTRKKIAFLETVVPAIGLTNVTLVCDRAEALSHQPDYGAAFDLALLRAVGDAAICAELGLNLVKPGGFTVLYRGQWSAADTANLRPVLKKHRVELINNAAWLTPLTQGQRHCLHLQKQ